MKAWRELAMNFIRLGGSQMQQSNRWMVMILIIACLQLAACTQTPASKTVERGTDEPARVERLLGTDLSRVILSAQAAKRLGIETAPVRDAKVRGKLRKVVP